ncbi:MAG: hypothetical protein ACREN0_12100, partial [Thermodesulfobacteriota bacterium]
MFNRYFSGLKLSSSALALLLIAAGLYFGACSKDKDETEQVEETEEVEVEVETPEKPAVAQPETDKGKKREGLPPEISEPCVGKSVGDPCVVVVSGGMEIKGTCKMTTRNILGCNPDPIINKDKVQDP